MKNKILEGIDRRIKSLETQLQMAYDNDLNKIVIDLDSRLDEMYSLKDWIDGLKND